MSDKHYSLENIISFDTPCLIIIYRQSKTNIISVPAIFSVVFMFLFNIFRMYRICCDLNQFLRSLNSLFCPNMLCFSGFDVLWSEFNPTIAIHNPVAFFKNYVRMNAYILSVYRCNKKVVSDIRPR